MCNTRVVIPQLVLFTYPTLSLKSNYYGVKRQLISFRHPS